MTSDRTPDGLHGADALCTIRDKTGPLACISLRPEEAAMLQDWHAACDDPDRRRALSGIIRRLS